MSTQGSEAAHDAKVVSLLGADADAVLAAAVAFPGLRVDLISRALDAGKVCKIKVPGARLLVFQTDPGVHAVVTELKHGGYRRAYRRIDSESVEALVAELNETYA